MAKPMNFRIRPLLAGILTAGALAMIGGCAGVSTHSMDTRHARQLEFENRFHATRRACESQGRTMIINASGGLGRSGAPRRGTLYFCG
ncbi:MAG: hypothetical protein QNJ40_00730 [Xanthomonadales bacterium]|nr:hypothetical protein [Xanthomonadales bacterium]